MGRRSLPARASRTLGVVVVATVLSAVAVRATADPTPPPSATPAVAAAPAPGGWERYPATDFTSAAGDLCRFTFTSTVLFDQVYVRTTKTFADGTPRRQEYVGPLVVKLTNTSNNASIVRDLSGRAVARYARDGSYTLAISGPVAVGFRQGDSLKRGYYVLRGQHVVRFAADGTRTVLVDRGTEENLCRALQT